MLKIAALVLDCYDDEDGSVARLLPTEVHACKVAARETVHALPDRCFGLVMKTASGHLERRFPLETADQLQVSQAYFEITKSSLPPQMHTIVMNKFAGVSLVHAGDGGAEAILAYNSVAYVDLADHEAPKVASKTASAQAWGLHQGDRALFPLHDAALVKTAADRFLSTCEGLSVDLRFLYARNIVKRAAALGVELDSQAPMFHYTSVALNPVSLSLAIDQRKAASAVGHELLDQISEASRCYLAAGDIETLDSHHFRQAKQAASAQIGPEQIIPLLQQFDKLAGLGDREYRRGLLDPFAACFKQAAGGGVYVDGVDLAKITPDMLERSFDAEFVSEFLASPLQVYQAVPTPVRNQLKQLAGGSTAQPPARQRAPLMSAGSPVEELNPTFANGRAMMS